MRGVFRLFRLSSEFRTKVRAAEGFHIMDSSGQANVHYDRWNEDNINMNVEASQSTMMRIYNRACMGRTGVIVKIAGSLAALVSIYIIGYATGYYVHRC